MSKQRISIAVDGKLVEWVDQLVSEGKFQSRDDLIEKCLMACAKRSMKPMQHRPSSGSSAVRTAVPHGMANAPSRSSSKKPSRPPSKSPPPLTVKVAILEGTVASPSESPSRKPPQPRCQSPSSSALKNAVLIGTGESSAQPPPRRPPELPWQNRKTKEEQKVYVYEGEA